MFGTFSYFCVLDMIHFPLSLRNTETAKILMCVCKRRETGATLMKTKISGAGAMFMKRAPDPELCHFYDSFAAMK